MFQLHNIIPAPLQDTPLGSSDIWATERRFVHGQRYFVAAPSGKGKSTFLHILYGLRDDYTGTALCNHTDLRGQSAAAKAADRQTRLSLVFQDLRLFLHLTAIENILIKNELTQHFSLPEITAMATRLGLTPYLAQTCETLSYGQRQRVAILRALCQPFEFLLLDEPFSHLDTDNVRAACALITEVADAQNAGYILVSLGETYPLVFDERLVL